MLKIVLSVLMSHISNHFTSFRSIHNATVTKFYILEELKYVTFVVVQLCKYDELVLSSNPPD